MAALETVLADTKTLILSDEVYEHIVFDHQIHESIAAYPGLAARSFVVSSFGKTYHTTGWKIGYCLAPAMLSKEFQRVHQFLTFSANTPIQLAYADILDRKDLYQETVILLSGQKRCFFILYGRFAIQTRPLQRNLFSNDAIRCHIGFTGC